MALFSSIGDASSRAATATEWNANDNTGVDAQFTVKGADVEPGHVTLRVEVSGGGFNGAGTFEIDIDGDHITSMTIH